MSLPDRIAVVISTYNAPELLRLVLEGYVRQTDMNFTIYVADDGSDEKTVELIVHYQQSCPVPIVHIWHEDQGFRKARVHNLALQRINEPYVLLTDGDSIPLPEMVETHRHLASQKTLISGGRVMLSRAWTQTLCKDSSFALPGAWHQWVSLRLRGNINRFIPLLFPVHLGAPHQRLTGIRGCHLSCWLEDLKRINGFDESFEGWGREDSDLVARLFHADVQRRDLRGLPVLHLWHEEQPRYRLDENDAMLQACLDERRQSALQGLRQLSENQHV